MGKTSLAKKRCCEVDEGCCEQKAEDFWISLGAGRLEGLGGKPREGEFCDLNSEWRMSGESHSFNEDLSKNPPRLAKA